MEELFECPVCNGKSFEPFLTCTDNTVSKENFTIVNCLKCNFKFTNPRPNAQNIGKYYESDDYVSHSDTKAGLINKLYHFIKKRAIENKIRLINNLNIKNKTLLDIGCGTGSFLKDIQQAGWTVSGIEPNDKARELAIKKNSVSVFEEKKLQELRDKSVSAITMWHVLEHVHDLKQRLNDIYRLLDNNGYAIIAVPNYTSWDAKHYKEKWAAYDVPRHLYHFSPQTVKKIFHENNLHHIKSLPMKFDSFYVSLLSEKYKKSSLKLLKAFIIGSLSNLKAKNDAEKYSSIIYIFQKK